MPTVLDRIQCLLQPRPYAEVRTLAKLERRSLSHMAGELIDEALKLPKYQELLAQAREEGASVPAKPDTRTQLRQRQTRSDDYIKEHLDGEVNRPEPEPERITRRRASASKKKERDPSRIDYSKLVTDPDYAQQVKGDMDAVDKEHSSSPSSSEATKEERMKKLSMLLDLI